MRQLTKEEIELMKRGLWSIENPSNITVYGRLPFSKREHELLEKCTNTESSHTSLALEYIDLIQEAYPNTNRESLISNINNTTCDILNALYKDTSFGCIVGIRKQKNLDDDAFCQFIPLEYIDTDLDFTVEYLDHEEVFVSEDIIRHMTIDPGCEAVFVIFTKKHEMKIPLEKIKRNPGYLHCAFNSGAFGLRWGFGDHVSNPFDEIKPRSIYATSSFARAIEIEMNWNPWKANLHLGYEYVKRFINKYLKGRAITYTYDRIGSKGCSEKTVVINSFEDMLEAYEACMKIKWID